MQNEKKKKSVEPQECDVFVPCPIVWSSDSGCMTPLPLITDCIMRA